MQTLRDLFPFMVFVWTKKKLGKFASFQYSDYIGNDQKKICFLWNLLEPWCHFLFVGLSWVSKKGVCNHEEVSWTENKVSPKGFKVGLPFLWSVTAFLKGMNKNRMNWGSRKIVISGKERDYKIRVGQM